MVEFRRRWGEEWSSDEAYGFQRDVEEALDKVLNEKHAPIMIPRTTIDPAHTAVAATSTAWTNLAWGSQGTTNSATFATILSYTGRGVLRKLVIAEITSGGAAANSVPVKLTVDGNVILNLNPGIATQSQLRVLVGSMHYTSISNIAVHDDAIGIPFNSSILIELATAAGTATAGWAISKKL